jgi:hypothetical protein
MVYINWERPLKEIKDCLLKWFAAESKIQVTSGREEVGTQSSEP